MRSLLDSRSQRLDDGRAGVAVSEAGLGGAERGRDAPPLAVRLRSVGGRCGQFADGGLCDLELVTDALARELVLD